MLYKKNSSESLSDELFRNPTAEYRGTPFWAWNTDLRIDELRRQIDIFREMGFGGFHMHVRTGMSTPYLSDEFMALIKECADKAEDNNMLAWLYDEDRWPSGAAGGLVTKEHKYRGRCILMTTEPCEIGSNRVEVVESCSRGDRNGEGYFVTCFDIVLDEKGRLKSYRRISEKDNAEGTRWYVYVKIHSDSPWYNNQAYVDTLNPDAIKKFIEVTHERYKEVIGDKFDKSVPSIFTDEPQFSRKATLKTSFDTRDCTLPWTDNLPETFKAAYGFDIVDRIPELFWELPDGEISLARYYYHDHVCERFTEAFADTIGKWCDENGIKLTGHMMEEPTLRSQTCALGEAMRSYRSFGIPGIDMLCASFEFTTAKQCQSAVHQYGKEGMLSELYGVTGWDYDFRGYKLHGDWQACLGVTVRVPHLSWVAMGGEAKRDYPASISYQSPWWNEFSNVENHFARVNTLMTRGKPVVKIGVIHPVESYWIHFGPEDLTRALRDEKDKKFCNLTEWLLKGSVDFDFISESLLPQICSTGVAPFRVGKMEYDAVIVPGCESLRSTTIERLEQFSATGGKIIFMGDMPTVCDGMKSDRCKELFAESVCIPYTREAILSETEEYRTVKITDEAGKLTDGFIYQLRKDTDGLNLFISRCREPEDKHKVHANNLKISVKGEFCPEIYDTATGEIRKTECSYENGFTVIAATLYDYDSLLLKLKNGKSDFRENKSSENSFREIEIPDKAAYELSERNALLIDMCEYALDDSAFMAADEILRLDNKCRNMLGWPDRGGHIPQPWSVEKEKIEHSITLRYQFESEIYFVGAELAIENAEEAEITFNGKAVPNKITGWWTDKDIKTIALPAINKGFNTLTVRIPFGRTTNTEWMYILGNFGVRTDGRTNVITSLPDKVAFGSITEQNMPFYGGNITYKIPVAAEKADISITHYMGTIISVSADGSIAGKIIYPPYRLTVDKPVNELEITLYGNRQNCFGPVHRTVTNGWIGPNAWRTENDEWSYNYCLRDIGIMEKPIIKIK